MKWNNVERVRGADWYFPVELARNDTDWETDTTFRFEVRIFKRDTETRSEAEPLGSDYEPDVAYSEETDYDVVTVSPFISREDTAAFPIGPLYADLRIDSPEIGVQYVAGWNIDCTAHATAPPE